MEYRCGLEGEMVVAVEKVKKVEVCVAAEVMRETVDMVVRRKRGRCFEGLEEIPEQSSEGGEDSYDLLQIGDKEFYFLLPVRSILGGPIGPPRHHVPNPNS
ncbi:hypothetical protein L6452_19277 [Arctium lappa]|uniref:Uncharacterized protein n=1 Tax=Arctium lappa TaxID=4217 RepID=A0ACB9B8N2_ARCLA|nr:hypothetical protein L6452_19277 [Arctium lappa]